MRRVVKLRINFDGSCDNRSKLKLMGSGIAVFIDGEFQGGESEGYGAQGTSNIAEYLALLMALNEVPKIVQQEKDYVVTIVGDSQLVVRQMEGVWAVKNEQLKEFYEQAKILEVQLKAMPNIKTLEYAWVPRQRNQEADKYSNLGQEKNF